MQVVLVMFTGEGERRSFSIARDMTVVGRREDCDLCIPVGDVSRKHCRLVKSPDAIKIEDLGSSNGTYVNGHRIQENVLNPGDWIQVGPVQFCVQIDGAPTDEQLASRSAGEAEETTAGLAAVEHEPEVPLDDQSLSASSIGSVLVEQPPEEESPLEEVPLEEEAPLEEVSSDDLEPLDPLELEEIPDDNAKLDDLDIDLDASPKNPGAH